MPNELIDYIARIISEDPNEPVQAQAPVQAKAQAPAQAQLGKRQIAMIKLVNEFQNANVPLTAEGYNQIGRSDGCLKILSSDGAWAKLCVSKVGSKILQDHISKENRKALLADFLRTISN